MKDLINVSGEMGWLLSGGMVGLSFLMSVWVTRRCQMPSSLFYILDHPNERSLHEHPIPRNGGIAVLTGILVGGLSSAALGFLPTYLGWFLPAMVVLALVAILDDWFRLHPIFRLISHFTAGGFLLAGGFQLGVFELPGLQWQWPIWMGMGFSWLYVVWMINLYNFMDGMDGFAGGMAFIGFSTFASLGWVDGNYFFMLANFLIAAAAFGFLFFNFPPAKIFLGDVGSTGLGFLVAAVSLWGAAEKVFPFWLAVLIFSPFIVDATATLLRRLWQRERFWHAHKSHYYQRLVLLGWGHRRAVMWEYILMGLCGISGFTSSLLSVRQQLVVLGGWVVFYCGVMVWVPHLESRRNALVAGSSSIVK